MCVYVSAREIVSERESVFVFASKREVCVSKRDFVGGDSVCVSERGKSVCELEGEYEREVRMSGERVCVSERQSMCVS